MEEQVDRKDKEEANEANMVSIVPRVESPDALSDDSEVRNIDPPASSSYAKLLKQSLRLDSSATAQKILEIDLQLKALKLQETALESKKARLLERLVNEQSGSKNNASNIIDDADIKAAQKIFKK